jgi:hypothetical protein
MRAGQVLKDAELTPTARALSRELSRRARLERNEGLWYWLSRVGLAFAIIGVVVLATRDWTARAADEKRDAVVTSMQDAFNVLCPAVPVGVKSESIADTCARAQRYDTEQPVAPGPAGPEGPPGEVGPPPSQEQIRLAVASYCASGACTGPAGATPTREQVAAAVVAYCATGACAGPVGPAGSPGEAGEDGAPASDAQVARAVDTYCATGTCAGPPGPTGPGGEQGRGIASVTVRTTDDGCVMTVTYTDVTTQDIPVPPALCLTPTGRR